MSGPRLSYSDLSPENAEEFLDLVFVKGELNNRFLYGRYPLAGEAAGVGTAPPAPRAAAPLRARRSASRTSPW